MDRVNSIMRHPMFVVSIERTNELEKDMDPFCRHGMEHYLDVARIAYTLYLESLDNSVLRDSHSGSCKELIYAAALLHDIGRARQYEDGTPHERASADIAEEILPECGFSEHESRLILDAIISHRTKSFVPRTGISDYIYRADKLSRLCFECSAYEECDWEMKNAQMEY